MRRMMPHDRNTIVADVSNDVQPWLSGDWKLTIKTAKWKNSNNYYKEEHKMQPALCIQHRRSRTAEESPLQNILKSFLVNRINERMTQIPIQHQGEDERQRKRKQRSTTLECQMYKLEMNLDDLGLARVVLPTQVYLTYCRGTCLMLDDPALFTVNALVRAKYTFLFGNDKVPSPECVPTHFRPLPFFVQLGDQISRVTFEDLDATKCGCR
ncbi:growth/differentiation factor 2-like [Macrobrachium rosenbergii]|uniref:growth/differentiation factor 2-like n=1 Tax=Macrobrachium rosenbergii TaxID=79674 RepID=UPI0034D70EC9